MDKNDWRIRNQEDYLYGKTLKLKKIIPFRTDHEHCDFCWQKIMNDDDPDVEREGYTTDGDTHWICKSCFDDFKVQFSWKVNESGVSYTYSDFERDLDIGHEIHFIFEENKYSISHNEMGWHLSKFKGEYQSFKNQDELLQNALIDGKKLVDIWSDIEVTDVF